tara:strand:+ start:1451 stop:1657 length:207 start_codon:yes stop_codon:yes gene_type:complete
MGVRVLCPKEVYTIVKTMYEEGYRVGYDFSDPRHYTKHRLLQDKTIEYWDKHRIRMKLIKYQKSKHYD